VSQCSAPFAERERAAWTLLPGSARGARRLRHTPLDRDRRAWRHSPRAHDPPPDRSGCAARTRARTGV